MRDGVPGFTMAEQEAVLTAAGIDLTYAYRDVVSRSAIKRRDPMDLKQRAVMLAKTSRKAPEMIVVAGLRVLGWTAADRLRVLALATQRNAKILAVDISEVFDPAAPSVRLLEAMADAEDTQRKAGTAEARKAGVPAAAAARARRREAALEEARVLWALPAGEISGTEIAKRVGRSLRNLHQHLGSREDARAKAKKKGKQL